MKLATLLKSILLLIFSVLFISNNNAQYLFKILPLGNSITYGENTDLDENGEPELCIGYRKVLYDQLIAGSYDFDYIGNMEGGWNAGLPQSAVDSLDYTDNGGFPGITTNGLLTLLQNGTRNATCQLPSCPQNYLNFYNPDIILLHIGTNGLTDSAHAVTFSNDVDDILDVIDTYESSHNKTVPVFLCQIINRAPGGNHQPTAYYNDLLAAVVSSRPADALTLVDMETGAGINYSLSGSGGDMHDVLHPDVTGNTKMANRFFTSISAYNFTPVLDNSVFSVAENTSNGTNVGTVRGYDFNPSHAITYSLTGSTLDGAFAVSGSGAITVANSNLLNFESDPVITLNVTGSSSGPLTDVATITINLTNVDEAPVLTTPGTQTITEDNTRTFNSGNSNLITVSDVDDASLTMTIAVTNGIFTLSGTSGITISSGANGTANFTFNGTIANINSALNNSVFTPNLNHFGSASIAITANDGTSNVNNSIPVTVNALNDAPELTNLESTPLSYTEGDGQVEITANILVADVDNTTLTSATIDLGGVYVNGQDVLDFVNFSTITHNFAAGTGTLTLTGPASLADFQTALRSVTFENTSTNPTPGAREISFTVNDGTTSSTPVTRNISVTANNAPVLANIEPGAITYTENGALLQVTNAITVTDDNDTHLESATITISSGFTSRDTLVFTNPGGIIGTFIAPTLTLTGHATEASYQTALRSVQYRNNSDNPTSTQRIVSFTVNDGDDNSNTVTRAINVTPVNDVPVLSAIESTSASYTENGPSIPVTSSIIVTDIDDTNIETATVTITTGYRNGQDILSFTNANGITGLWNASLGRITLTGPAIPANFQTALQSVRYINTSGNPNTNNRIVTFVVNDGDDNSIGVTRTITVDAVNDQPVLLNIESDPILYTEGTIPNPIITNTIIVNDTDNLNLVSAEIQISSGYQLRDTLTYSGSLPAGITSTWVAPSLRLSGTSLLSNYQTALRMIRFSTGDNPGIAQRTISFTVTDSSNAASVPLTRNINVTPVNDLPVLSQTNTSAISYTEGTPVIIASTLAIVDPDNTSLSSATIRITGNYQSGEDTLIYGGTLTDTWNETTGTLTLTGPATIASFQTELRNITYSTSNNPNSATRTISFTINDNAGASNILTKNINVVPVDDKPYATNISINATSLLVGANATGSFTYNDYETNPPGTHIYRWLRADNSSGLNKTQISGATTTTYTFKQADENKYIAFIVTPVQSSPANTGIADTSGWIGPVGESRPTATISGGGKICPAGSPATISIALTGVPGWRVTVRRSSGTSFTDSTITNIKTSPRVFQTTSIGTYTILNVADTNYQTPVSTGNDSAKVETILSPHATISGSAIVCPYDSAVMQINFTGAQPWSITYTRNGLNPKTVNGIIEADSSYNLKVFGDGLYQLTSVSNSSGAGCISGSGQVTHRILPEATLTGGGDICENTNGTLSVSLTGGTLPWNIKYMKDDLVLDSVMNINSSPRVITLNEPYRIEPYTYHLTEVTDKYCKGTVSGNAVLTVKEAPKPDITGLKATYSITSAADTAVGKPSGGSFSGPSLVGINDSSVVFLPWTLQVGTYNITYSYQAPNSCWGIDTAKINVIDKVADILFPGYPEEERTIFCKNDPPFVIEGVNINNATGTFSISGGIGLVDNGDNTATVYPELLQGGVHNITYHNPLQNITQSFNTGAAPTAEYTWTSECFSEGLPINFKDNSTSNNYGSINSYSWKFYQDDTVEIKTGENTSYTFSQPENYSIEHKITTNYGCTDSIEKTFPLRPTLIIDQDSYTEDFELGDDGWSVGQANGSAINSWIFGEPSTDFSGAASGANAWYTSINPGIAEQSWVTSPCFDFSHMKKPMVKFNIWRQFDLVNKSGAVLQYTNDSITGWTTLGEIEDGINWYNKYNLDGAPGEQGVLGWASVKDNNWIEARHNLDSLKGKKNVQFRLAYGSTNALTDNKGIAFDNFWLGERQKIVLLEHFTNLSDELCLKSDSTVKSAAQQYLGDLIDVQYHTSFPGDDALNELNQSVPGARVFYYSVNDVPNTLMDGGNTLSKRYNHDSRPLSSKDLNIQSLIDPFFKLKVNTDISGNTLNIGVDITTLKSLYSRALTLQILVLEKEISNVAGADTSLVFRNTVRDMVPGTTGTYFYQNWNVDDMETVNETWEINDIFDIDQLRVVAFLQDVQNKEIYQASIDKSDFPSGINKDNYLQEFKFMIYPNPARQNVYLLFNEPVEKNSQYNIYNMSGILVQTGIIDPGSEETELDIYNLKKGMYFIQVIDSSKTVGLQKLIVAD